MGKVYRNIRVWGKLTGSRQYYIDAQVKLAEKDNAPETAVYRGSDGVWVTSADVENENIKKYLD